MSRQISVSVYKDEVSTYPDGCTRNVSANSMLLGVDPNVYLQIFPVDSCIGETLAPSSLLRIKNENGKMLWIGDTITSWQQKVNGIDCCGFGAPGQVVTITRSADDPLIYLLESSVLYNLNIGTITKGGTAIYNVPYTSNPGPLTGTLDLTDFGGLAPRETIQITLKS